MQQTNSAVREVLEAALQHALAHLENLDREPVAAVATLETLRNRLDKPLDEEVSRRSRSSRNW